MSKHTLSMIVGDTYIGKETFTELCRVVETAEGPHRVVIAKTLLVAPGHSYEMANEIATACNSYDKLVSALQSCRDLIERGNYTSAESALVLKEVREVLGE